MNPDKNIDKTISTILPSENKNISSLQTITASFAEAILPLNCSETNFISSVNTYPSKAKTLTTPFEYRR